MAKFCALFSGSKANCTYISGSNGAVLVDTGASAKAILNAIDEIGEDTQNIKAILVTHEHSDHIKGLKAITKKLNVPVIASSKTLDAITNINAVDAGANLIPLDSGTLDSQVGGIVRFETKHDCEGSSGYSIILPDQTKISVCTDLGIVTSSVREALKGSNIVLLESNHDIRMLQSGPYPPELKLRIAGEYGHLSNSAAASELVDLLHSGTTRFILGHLSENNNLPALAIRTSEAALMDAGAKKSEDYLLSCAVRENREIIYF
jgi:phosphoribosyl 1,2-cyclic phosphodiesterase